MGIILLLRGVFRLGFREKMLHYFSSHGVTTPSRPGPFPHPGFTITLGHTTLVRLPWTSYRPEAETPDCSQNSQVKSKLAPAEFETEIPASERLQTHTLDRESATMHCGVKNNVNMQEIINKLSTYSTPESVQI
jgi:hypothetical protein